ncbi:MAG: AMP-dependent synthetase [Rhodothalassiaceae bacterium]|nr:MAG: AMP-dependent synthetase [Rhodothalassiaceae bacterium]
MTLTGAEPSTSLVAAFWRQVEAGPERTFLAAKRDGRYHGMTWKEVAGAIARLARGLKAQGVEPGDRVVLVSENRPEWLIADFAIMTLGAVTVPAYTTNTVRDHLHILENSGAKGVIVSTRRLLKNTLPAAHQSDATEFVITMEDVALKQSLNARLLAWDAVLEGTADDLAILEEAAGRFRREDLACIIYTSGTGGAPKGVMLSHGAILSNCEDAHDVLAPTLGLEGHRFLSFLPLSHAYEHTAGQMLPVTLGAEIYYAESVEKLATNMAEARPTIMVVVPRLFEMLRQRVQAAIRKEGGLKARLFEEALRLGIKRTRAPDSLTLGERIRDRALDALVRAKVRRRFGGRLKALVSGGAPLNPGVGEFFVALGLRLLQGYGQTEAAPIISVNRPEHPKIHTVGPPLKSVTVRIADDGEILVRGELVMKGYWRDEATTRRTIVDGWLHTGDIGMIDEDGHLVITDRKKDIIVLDKGENISPARVEGMLTLEPEIAQAMVYGDSRPYLVGLIVPDAEWAAEWARAHGLPAKLEELAGQAAFRRAVEDAVERVNRRLAALERVRRFALLAEPFTIENGMMTPTLKVRRHKVRERYGELIESLYGGGSTAGGKDSSMTAAGRDGDEGGRR